MSFWDPDYNPRADYDMDGKVDDFEYGMFLHEMEEEDRAIEEGRAFSAPDVLLTSQKKTILGSTWSIARSWTPTMTGPKA